jgi:DNA uptake protein ComE-like DNA-binding protein
MRKLSALLLLLLLIGAFSLPALAAEPKPAAAVDPANIRAEPIDINSAGESQLKALPGIGDAYAAKIIAGRPYAKKDQLKSRGILPAATYDKIQDQIVARQNNR